MELVSPGRRTFMNYTAFIHLVCPLVSMSMGISVRIWVGRTDQFIWESTIRFVAI